jgi:zinc/manganese transport system substrate-binding protein
MIRRPLYGILTSLTLFMGLSFAQAQDPIRVVATYSILGDMVRNVGGDSIELTVLVGADSDSHTYEPTPQDAITLSEADIIFENGLEFESWFDELYEASGSTAVRVEVSAGIELLEFEGQHDEHEGEMEVSAEATHEADHMEATAEATHEGEEEHEGEHDGEHEQGEYDPHIWHSVENAKIMVANIRDGLASVDAANMLTYEANALVYLDQLTELETFVDQKLTELPEANRILVTSHDTFGYLAREYNFEVLTVLESVSTEASDPSAGQIAELVTEIQEEGVKAIFAENITNPDLLNTVAQEAGVVVAPTLYTDALGAEGTAAATYIEMMQYNITTIVDALK